MKVFITYLIKFLVVFGILYYGTIAFIGLAAPGGYYIPFFDHYLNYPSWLRASLLICSQALLSLFGYHTTLPGQYLIRLSTGSSVRIVYTCLGYGIMSFWIAFVFANKGAWKKKALWILAGLAAIWFINVVRISLLLVATSKGKKMPWGLDHHTLFNICAYALVFAMIFLYDSSRKDKILNFKF